MGHEQAQMAGREFRRTLAGQQAEQREGGRGERFAEHVPVSPTAHMRTDHARKGQFRHMLKISPRQRGRRLGHAAHVRHQQHGKSQSAGHMG